MKQGAAINRIVMLLLAGALVLYLAGAAYRAFRDPYSTVQAYEYAVDDTVEATGYLVRQEQVLLNASQAGGIVRVLPGEGEKVAVGATVALHYADQAALERSNRLDLLETQAGQLRDAIAAVDSGSEDRSGQGVLDALTELRTAVASGDFTTLEDRTSEFKSAVYQQAQRHGEAGDLAAALATLQAEMDRLSASTSDVGRTAVAQSGIFSGQADGYEAIFTPESLESLTLADLDALADRNITPPANAVGKLITDSKWYFVCPLSWSDAQRLTEGGTVTARFSRDWSGEVDMTVERIGAPQNDRCAVILSSTRYLSQVTLLRRQTVELIFSTKTGLRVPTAAVRVEEGQSVVYVQVGAFAERKTVTVLAQGEDYTLVKPLLPEDAAEKEEKKILRSGDAVVIAGEEIWDGKVIE